MKRKFANKIVIGVILFLLISSSIMILNVKASLPQEPIYPSYSGYVKDSNGNPLSNAHLQLIDLGSQVAEDYTDSNGYYCFYTDMVSSPGLKASKTDYKSETISVSTSGGTYNFYLESLGSKYTGFVKDKTGDSIANALVKLLSFGNKASQDYTSTDGSFELYGENVYYAELEASKSGYITKTIDVSDTGGTYTIELEKQLYTFDGYVRDTNDNSLANADVKLYSNNNYITSDKTDSNGYYSMQHELIKNGEIKVTKEWYQSASKTVTNTGGTYNFALEFIPHIELTGKVTHSEKNYGIPDVTVRVYKKGTSPYNNAVTTTTDNDGEFCLGIEEDSDEYILLARHPYYFSKGKRFVPDTNADFSFVLKERIDRTHLNYFENFEGQISDAWNWIYEDQDDIQITYSDNEDLIDDFSYGDTKLIKFEYDTKPSSYLVRDITKNLASPLLISFKAAFNTPSSFTDTYGYVDFTINDDMGDTWQLQIGFYTDSIQLFAPPDHPTYHTSGYLLQDHLIPKQLYQIDIILNTNEQNENIVYSIYINGEYAKSASTERKGISTDKIEIGQHVHSYTTQFYMDDLYINNVYINTLEENKPLNIASPLCWVFAPDAEGVENYYKIIHTLNVDFTLSLGFSLGAEIFGIGMKVSLSFGDIEIIGLTIINDEQHYGVGLTNENDDVIVHIRNELTYTLKEVIVPDYNEPLFKFLTDLKHLRTEYQHYTESRYIEEYNEIPQNPRDSGLDYIKTDYANYDHIGSIPTHTRTVRKKEEVYLLGSIGLIGFIKGKLTCSEEYYVIAELKVLSSVEPFNIYLPKEYDAFLDLQPYIVIPLQLPEINTKSTDAEDNIFDDPIEQKVSSITTTTKTKPLLEII